MIGMIGMMTDAALARAGAERSRIGDKADLTLPQGLSFVGIAPLAVSASYPPILADYWRLGLPMSVIVVLCGTPLIAAIWPPA